jgi:hypothetical protein
MQFAQDPRAGGVGGEVEAHDAIRLERRGQFPQARRVARSPDRPSFKDRMA